MASRLPATTAALSEAAPSSEKCQKFRHYWQSGVEVAPSWFGILISCVTMIWLSECLNAGMGFGFGEDKLVFLSFLGADNGHVRYMHTIPQAVSYLPLLCPGWVEATTVK